MNATMQYTHVVRRIPRNGRQRDVFTLPFEDFLVKRINFTRENRYFIVVEMIAELERKKSNKNDIKGPF